MRLRDLPDINFLDVEPEKVKNEIFELFESCTGRKLAKGDPVRLFILAIANAVILLKNEINETGKQNLLKYAKGDMLEHLGVLVGTDRLPSLPAHTTVKFTLSEARSDDVIIPKGTRVTAGDNVFFAVDESYIIQAGQTEATLKATCLTHGEIGNGYKANSLTTLVDPIAYVSGVTNTTMTEGGQDRESDDSYREAIAEAPEKFSTAGPTGAYEFHVKRVSNLITDVKVTSPKAGDVLIVPLMAGGEIPQSEMLKAIGEAVNDKAVRPLTDHVEVKAPTVVNYDINFKYYICTEDIGRTKAIKDAVDKAVESFKQWQMAKLGRDINPTELYAQLRSAGVKRIEITSPVFTKVDGNQVAKAQSVDVKLGGVEDE